MAGPSISLSLILAARALAPAAVAADLPEYPISLAEVRCLGTPCGKAQITDLSLTGALGHLENAEGRVRVRIGDRLVVGAWSDRAGDGARLTSSRFDLAMTRGKDGDDRVAAAFRLARLDVNLATATRPDWLGGGRTTSGSVVVSPSADLYVSVAGVVEADRGDEARFGSQVQREGSLELAWQPGTTFEARVRHSIGRVRRVDDTLSSTGSSTLEVGWTRGWINLAAEAGYESSSGRLGYRHGLARLGIDARIGSRTVVHGSTWNRWEPGLKKVERDVEIGWTLYARPFSFQRGSASAARARDLVVRARELGYRESLPVGDRARRDLRERLSLSADREELDGLIDALYHAQISDRNVVRLAARYRRSTDSWNGTTRETIGAAFGVPWPLSSTPGVDDDAVVEFLTADVEYERMDWGGFISTGHRIGLRAALHRDAALNVAWEHLPRTLLQSALAEVPVTAIRISLDYSFQR